LIPADKIGLLMGRPGSSKVPFAAYRDGRLRARPDSRLHPVRMRALRNSINVRVATVGYRFGAVIM
jgi:hypothetical protein